MIIGVPCCPVCGADVLHAFPMQAFCSTNCELIFRRASQEREAGANSPALCMDKSELSNPLASDDLDELLKRLRAECQANDPAPSEDELLAFVLEKLHVAAYDGSGRAEKLTPWTDWLPREKASALGFLASVRRALQPAAPSKNVVRGLEGMRELHDGWDSYNGKKPTEAAIVAVETMQACPTSDGGIQLDWGDFQSVEIGPDGKIVEEQAQPAAPSPARTELCRYLKARDEMLPADRLRLDGDGIAKRLDAFEAEIRAEALQPAAAPSADLAEAEEWLRQQWGPHGQKLASAIAAALDRLRAENNQLRLDVAAVTEDFQQLTRECDELRDERDRIKLYEPRFHAALMDLRDVVQGALTCDRISDLTTAVSLSQAAERATKVLDGVEESDEMARLRAFAAKVREEVRINPFAENLGAALRDAIVRIREHLGRLDQAGGKE